MDKVIHGSFNRESLSSSSPQLGLSVILRPQASDDGGQPQPGARRGDEAERVSASNPHKIRIACNGTRI
jgi:hypothetical protein